jgi:hypothetical protein
MTNRLIQNSFSTGEVSPTLLGRTDLAKYKTGARVMRNFFVDYRGGASTRAGTKYIGYTKSVARLIPFKFSATQGAVLEFGDHYMRVIVGAGYVTEPAFALSAFPSTNPLQVTAVGHNFAVGDLLFYNGTGNPQLDGELYPVMAVAGDIITVGNIFGNTNIPVGAAVGTVARVYTAVSPFAAADLAVLKYTQFLDVITLTHPSYPPYNLTRLSYTDWTFITITFAAKVLPPTLVSVTQSAPTAPSTPAPAVYQYTVTSVDATGEESLPATTLTLSGGSIYNMGVVQASNFLGWTGPALPVDHYNVYRTAAFAGNTVQTGAEMGYVGNADHTGGGFIDNNVVADFTKVPPTHFNPFPGPGDYPSVCGYYQQRRVFAATANKPTTLWGSRPGLFNNFDTTTPVVDTDSFNFTLSSNQINDIKWMVAMPGGLVIFTGGGLWQLSGGGQNTPLTPTNATATPQSATGCADVPPIVINFNILYVQQKGNAVRDLSYNFYANIYTGVDTTIYSNHLFYGHQIVEMAYVEEPFKVIWAVRDDGTLLSLTYLQEQQLAGWARHDTAGTVESVATIPSVDGKEDSLYMIVNRTLNGQSVRCVELMATRNYAAGPATAWCVDSGVGIGPGTPVSTVGGLSHLEGQTVAVVADGVVLPPTIVVGGQIALAMPASIVIVGLPFQAQLQTLPVEVTGGETLQGRRKEIQAVVSRLNETRGLKVGSDPAFLQPITDTTYSLGPTDFVSLDERTIATSAWDDYGRVFYQQDDPLPATVLASVMEINLGD